jgi:hypothetical protein
VTVLLSATSVPPSARATAALSTPGQRAQPLEEAAREIARGRPFHVARGHVVRGEEHAFATEARIGFAGLGEAAEKHRGCEQNEQRDADLAGHQQVAHPAPSRGADAGSNRGLRIDARELQRGTDPEKRAAAEPERHREREADDVEIGLKPDRERADDRDGPHRVGRPRRDRRAERDAEAGEQEVFNQQQTRNASTAGAEREADADLALPHRRSSQHQVRGVAADREQQQQHHALQNQQCVREHALRPARRLPERQHFPR